VCGGGGCLGGEGDMGVGGLFGGGGGGVVEGGGEVFFFGVDR